jgi:hypothetical protein
MDITKDVNDFQRPRSNDHLWCDWFSVANILPERIGTPCQHCESHDAIYWNHDDELGELLYCEDCADMVYEPFIYEEIEPASPELLADTLTFITEKRAVTFRQLVGFLEARGVPTDGDFALAHPDDCTLRIWSDMSGTMIDLVTTWEDEGDIVYRSTSRQTYLDDGGVPDFAQPKPPNKHGVPWRDPWVPTVLVPRPRDIDSSDLEP